MKLDFLRELKSGTIYVRKEVINMLGWRNYSRLPKLFLKSIIKHKILGQLLNYSGKKVYYTQFMIMDCACYISLLRRKN